MPMINRPDKSNEFSLTERRKNKIIFPYRKKASRKRVGDLEPFHLADLTTKQKNSRERAILKYGKKL